jgi:hypothetical protein
LSAAFSLTLIGWCREEYLVCALQFCLDAYDPGFPFLFRHRSFFIDQQKFGTLSVWSFFSQVGQTAAVAKLG